jgi:hypothetical protein
LSESTRYKIQLWILIFGFMFANLWALSRMSSDYQAERDAAERQAVAQEKMAQELNQIKQILASWEWERNRSGLP